MKAAEEVAMDIARKLTEGKNMKRNRHIMNDIEDKLKARAKEGGMRKQYDVLANIGEPGSLEKWVYTAATREEANDWIEANAHPAIEYRVKEVRWYGKTR